MEKLLQLLNEYEEKRIEKINSEWKLMVKLSFNPYTEESLTNKAYRSCWLEICSKHYWFIKWLVDNDKIDYHNKINYDISLAINRVTKKTTREERLLMMLAIQEEPIKYLCEILK